MKIIDIEGIGPAKAEKLKAVGIDTTADFLASAATAKDRAALSEKTGIAEQLLLEWANHVDLMRIDGVGSEYADLLEAAGVDSCPELAQRNPANLTATLREINDNKSLVRQVPSESMVEKWVVEAAKLPKVITH